MTANFRPFRFRCPYAIAGLFDLVDVIKVRESVTLKISWNSNLRSRIFFSQLLVLTIVTCLAKLLINSSSRFAGSHRKTARVSYERKSIGLYSENS